MTVEVGAVRASASLDSAGIETGVRSARSQLRVLEGGFQKTSREAVRSAEAMGRAWDDGMSRASSATRDQIEALTGLDRASKATSATAKSWVAQLNRQAQSFDRLRSSVDPIFGSTKQYEAAVKQAERAVQSGIVSQEEANRVLDKAAQKYLGLVPAAQQAAEAQEKAAQQARSAKEAYERTRASLDPLFASSKQYESVVKQMNAAVKTGAVSQSEANRVLKLAEARYLGVAGAANSAAAPTRGFLSLFSKDRTHDLRNFSMQLSQVGQQGAVTGDYFTALTIQAADMGIVFGGVGIAIGTAISVLGPMAANFLFGADSAEEFSDRVDDLSAAVSEYREYADLASTSTSDLERRFGSAAGSAGEIAAFMQEFARADAVHQLDAAVEDLTERFGGLSSSLVALDTSRGFFASLFDKTGVGLIEEYRNTMLVLQQELGITAEQSDAVVRSLARLGEADTPKAAVDAAAQLHREFLAVFGAVEDIPQPLLEIAKQTGLIAFEAGELLTIEQKGNIERHRQAEISAAIIANYTDQAAMANAVAEHGKDSAQVEELKRAAALKAAEAMIEQENLSGIVAQRVRAAALAAYDAEQNSARAAVALRDAEAAAKGLASAIASAAGFSANLEGGVRILEAEVRALESGADAAIASGLEAKRIRAESMRDAQVAAGQDRLIADAQLALDLAAIDRQGFLIQQKKKLAEASRKAGSASAASSKNSLAGLQAEILQRKTLLEMTGAQRSKYLSLIEVQRRLGKSASKYSKAQIEALADELVMLDRKEEKLRQLEGYARDTADDIASALLDPGSAKDAAKSYVREVAHQFLSQQIVLPVIAQLVGVDGISGVATQAVGGATGGAGGGGLLSGVLNAGGTLSGAGAGIGSGLMGVLSGGGLGSSFANLGGLLSGASAGWGALGAALPAIGIIAAGVAVLVKGFSRKYKGSGIGGAFTPDGLVGGHKFDFYKGGWFRSDKWDRKDLEHEFQSALDDAMISLSDGVVGMADTLNLGTKALKNFEQENFTIWTNGKSQEEIQQALQGEMQKTAEQMAELILKNEDYLRIGETHLEALTRLSTGLLAVNDAMDILGQTAFEASLKGGDAASHLVDQFGSVEAMAGAVSAYWNGFYTEAERQETTVRRLQEQFEALGVSMPESRAGFRELVEGIDLTSASGRGLYAELLNLSGAMDQVLPKVGAYTEAMQGIVDQIGGEIGVQIGAARDMARVSEQSAQLWYRTATTLRDFLSDLLNTDLTAASRSQAAAVNRGRFETVFDLARGGDVEAARDVPALAKAYLQSARATAATSLEYRRIAAQVQGQVNFLAGIADLEGANDDVLRGLYEQQIEVLTGLGRFLQLEGLTSDQVAELGDGVQALTENWDGTVEAFEGSLRALEDAIRNAEAFSYDDLVGRLDVAVSLADDAPRWVRRLVDNADTGLRTALDFVIRNDELSPADKWIATNSVSEHVSALDFVLRNDLDQATRRLVLETTGELYRDLNLTLAEDLDADTRQMLLTRNQGLSRRVNVALTKEGGKTIRSLNRLQDLIGTKGTGKITFDGGLSLTSDQAFKGLSDGVQDLLTPINRLRGMLGDLRDAVDADRQQRENALKIAGWQVKGADAVARTQQAQGVVDEFNALRSQYGITLTGQKGTVSVNDAGRIVTSFDYYGGGDVVGFKKALREEFGTEYIGRVFGKTNDRIGNAEDRAEQLRQQIRDLGGIPAFANGGTHRGGLARVGENDIELVAPSRIYNPRETKAMLDNREVVAELRKANTRIESLEDTIQQLMLSNIKHAKRSSDALTRFERDPGSLKVTQVTE